MLRNKILTIFPFSFAFLFWSVLADAQGNDLMQLRVSAGYEGNVPRGVDSFHERGSGFVDVGLFAGKFYQLGLQNSAVFGIDTSARRYIDLSGFDELRLGLSGSLSHRFGLGAYAPTLNLDLQYLQTHSRGVARDRRSLTTALVYQQRLSPAWLFSAGVDYSDSQNQNNLPEDPRVTAFGYDPNISLPYELYDFDSRSLFVGLEYTFSNFVLLNTEYRRGSGHTVASTTQPALKTYKISKAFYSDPAFSQDWFAYLLPSTHHELSSTVSIPLSDDSAFDLTATWVDIAAPIGKRYENSLFIASLIWRF